MNQKLKKYLLFVFAFIYALTFIIMLLSLYNVISSSVIITVLIILGILIGIGYNVDGIVRYVEPLRVRRFIRRLSQENQKKLKPKKVFRINDVIEMKLILDKTYIYIKGKEFMQCMYLLINIPIKNIEDYDEYENIDDIAEELDHSLEMGPRYNNIKTINSETEFWGHCSNIQAFFENGLDTCILHSNIAFPLLKELVKVKYKPAYFKFREEVVRRFNEGNDNVRKFLLIEGYIGQLEKEDFEQLDLDVYDSILKLEEVRDHLSWRYVEGLGSWD